MFALVLGAVTCQHSLPSPGHRGERSSYSGHRALRSTLELRAESAAAPSGRSLDRARQLMSTPAWTSGSSCLDSRGGLASIGKH